MDRIYRTSGAQLIWLGSGNYETNLVFDITAGLNEGFVLLELLKRSKDYYMRISEILVAFGLVLRKRYWRRRWVIQEMTFRIEDPYRYLVLCGTKEVALQRLRHACSVACELYHEIYNNVGVSPRFKDTAQYTWQEPAAIHRAVENFSNLIPPEDSTDPTALARLLDNFHSHECSVALDRVYALLSMSLEGHMIAPDYDTDLRKLFWRLSGFEGISNTAYRGRP